MIGLLAKGGTFAPHLHLIRLLNDTQCILMPEAPRDTNENPTTLDPIKDQNPKCKSKALKTTRYA